MVYLQQLQTLSRIHTAKFYLSGFHASKFWVNAWAIFYSLLHHRLVLSGHPLNLLIFTGGRRQARPAFSLQQNFAKLLAKGMAYFYRHLRRSLVLHGHGYGCCTGVYWHAWTDLRIRLWKLCCIISRSYPCRIEGWKIYLDWSNIVCSFPSYVTKGIKWSMHWPLRLLFQLRGCS